MTAFAAGGQDDIRGASRPIYRDPRETSLTLMVLGGTVAIASAAQLGWPGRLGDGLGISSVGVALLLAIAFAILALTFGRRAASRGMRRPPGFGIAAIICLAAIVPPFLVAVFYAGPFLVFGLGLVTVGLKLGNRVLTWWALGVGGVGVFEGFFGITNRLPLAIWAAWEHVAIYLMLGAVTFVAGLVIGVRERRAAL